MSNCKLEPLQLLLTILWHVCGAYTMPSWRSFCCHACLILWYVNATFKCCLNCICIVKFIVLIKIFSALLCSNGTANKYVSLVCVAKKCKITVVSLKDKSKSKPNLLLYLRNSWYNSALHINRRLTIKDIYYHFMGNASENVMYTNLLISLGNYRSKFIVIISSFQLVNTNYPTTYSICYNMPQIYLALT